MKSTRRCGSCDEVVPFKLTSVYARWYPVGEDSVGYVARLCDACLEKHLVPWLLAACREHMAEGSCGMCGDLAVERYSYTWITAYRRNEEANRFTSTVCENCAIRLRATMSDTGSRLEDRLSPPAREQPSYWASLGIQPQA